MNWLTCTLFPLHLYSIWILFWRSKWLPYIHHKKHQTEIYIEIHFGLNNYILSMKTLGHCPAEYIPIWCPWKIMVISWVQIKYKQSRESFSPNVNYYLHRRFFSEFLTSLLIIMLLLQILHPLISNHPWIMNLSQSMYIQFYIEWINVTHRHEISIDVITGWIWSDREFNSTVII